VTAPYGCFADLHTGASLAVERPVGTWKIKLLGTLDLYRIYIQIQSYARRHEFITYCSGSRETVN
jgi:hypothetical protein